jgi:hypothetical protein
VRILIRFNAGNLTCVSWKEVTSDHFKVTNGVRPGGVLSPVLFCAYIEGLLLMLFEDLAVIFDIIL